jgi:hypothetical protein
MVENDIIQDKDEENDDYSQETGGQRTDKILQPGSPVHILIKSSEII